MSSSKSLGIVKLTGILSLVAGIVLIIAGGVVWGMITSQLSAEKMTIGDDAPMAFTRGQAVNGPITAYSQAEVINMHALAGSEGTYAELGAMVREATAAGDEDRAAELQAQRNTMMNASFLRASLFTSVVAYGVSALVMGLGLMFILIGLSLNKVVKVEAAPVLVEASKE